MRQKSTKIFQLANSKTKIFCMIRIRRGDFNYSNDEVEAMMADVKFFKQHGADGIVIGCLDEESKIHVGNCRKIISAWGCEKPITFHRAFDETARNDYQNNIEIVIGLGCSRILSSGFESSAELGMENLSLMVNYSREKSMTIMPGAGINKDNVARIITATNCKEIHASARSPFKQSASSKLSMGGGDEGLQPLMVCNLIKVRELLELSNLS